MATGDLFNESWYLRNNPDIAAVVEAGVIDAFTHFQLYGRFEGRSPDPAFDPGYYLESNPDIAAAVQAGNITAYDHFVSYGANETRSFVPYFDPVFYLQSNPDIAAAVEQGLISVVDHFLLYGQGESRAISPFFDLGAYLQANPDVANADGGAGGALEHLLLYGFAEGRDLGNGVSLAQFQDDPVFQQALESGGNPFDALARVAEVAPFLPSFQPPAGWAPPADTPIPVDFVPVEGEKMVIPPSVVVPDDVELPDTFEPVEPAPEPEPGPGPAPVRVFEATLEDGVISFVSQNLSGDVTVTLAESGDSYIATFVRGTAQSAVTIAKNDLEDTTLEWGSVGVNAFKPGVGTVLVLSSEEDGTAGKLSATIQGGVDASAEHGSVLVGSGDYAEAVTIEKAGIKLLGPNANIDPNTGVRVAEATLSPDRNGADDSTDLYVVTFTESAKGGLLSGFTIVGDHTGGEFTHPMQSGVSVESDGTTIENNIIDGFNYIGVRVNHFTYDEETQKWAIHLVQDVEVANNQISNVLREVGNEDSAGHAIYYQGAVGDVHGNTILYSENGIQIQPYGQAFGKDLYEDLDAEFAPSVYNNTIEAAYRGIWLNYAQDDAPLWEVRGNVITAAPGNVEQDDWQGIWIQTFQGGEGFKVFDNIVDGDGIDVPTYGIRFTGITGDPSLLSVSGNDFENVDGHYYNANGGVLSFTADGGLKLFPSIQEAVSDAGAGEIVHVGPGDYKEEVIFDDVASDVEIKIVGLGDKSPVVDGSDGAYAIRATGAGFQGTVTIEGLTILTGSQGGIGQYMSASAGTFHVLSNTVGPSEGSFAVHGNAIQISGAGSTVIGNDVTVAEYTSDITNWSTSGITVVKDASNARIEGNTVRGPEGIEDGNSVIGIAVDAKYTDAEEGMSGISILDNEVTNLTAGISLSDRVDAEVSGNVVTGNLTGIRLGSTQAGWNDELNLDIVGNTFSANDRAIAISDFDGGGTIAIKGNTFEADEMTGAIWLNGLGTYKEGAKIEIDLTQFSTGQGLAQGVVHSADSDFLDHMVVPASEPAGDAIHVTWSEGIFEGLTLVLMGAAGYEQEEIYDFLGATLPVI